MEKKTRIRRVVRQGRLRIMSTPGNNLRRRQMKDLRHSEILGAKKGNKRQSRQREIY